TQNQFDGGGFPRTIQPQQTEDLTSFYLEINTDDAAGGGGAAEMGPLVGFGEVGEKEKGLRHNLNFNQPHVDDRSVGANRFQHFIGNVFIHGEDAHRLPARRSAADFEAGD